MRPQQAGRFAGVRPPSYSFSVECSFAELYCEDVFDLLDPNGQRRPLAVVEDRIRGWHARNLTGAHGPAPLRQPQERL